VILIGIGIGGGAGDIAMQHLVLDCEQLAAALRQMRFRRGFMGEEMIEPAVKPIFGDLLIAELEQIAQSVRRYQSK
jgi:hypothetical protein